KYTVTATATPTGNAHLVQVTFDIEEGGALSSGHAYEFESGAPQAVTVITDPEKHLLEVVVNGAPDVAATPNQVQPIRTGLANSGSASALSVRDEATHPTLCQSL